MSDHVLGMVLYRDLQSYVDDGFDFRQAYAICSCGVGFGQNFSAHAPPVVARMAAEEVRRYFREHLESA